MVAYQRKTPPHPPTGSQGHEAPHAPDLRLQSLRCPGDTLGGGGGRKKGRPPIPGATWLSFNALPVASSQAARDSRSGARSCSRTESKLQLLKGQVLFSAVVLRTLDLSCSNQFPTLSRGS